MSLGYTLRVIPAIIAETPKELDEKLRRVLGFSKMVMLDVMDGVFVESRSINFTSDLPSGILYQSHLMVKDPLHYAETIRGKVDTAIIHIESISGIKEIEQIKKMDFNVFLALNPGTPASCVIPHLSLIDGVLIMTVEPGRYGAPFIHGCLNKVAEIKKIKPNLIIEVDGGMTPETASLAKLAGANLFASGSYIVNNSDPYRAFREIEMAVNSS